MKNYRKTKLTLDRANKKKKIEISSDAVDVELIYPKQYHSSRFQTRWFSSTSKKDIEKGAPIVRPKEKAIRYGRSLSGGKIPGGMSIVSCQMFKNKGFRKFGIVTWPSFYRSYVGIRSEDRNYYEIIREGAPCKLYFDIDVNLSISKDVKSVTEKYRDYRIEKEKIDKKVELFVSYVFEVLRSLYGISIFKTTNDEEEEKKKKNKKQHKKMKINPSKFVRWLDSSKGEKYSVHLIFDFNYTGTMFMDNSHVKTLVYYIYGVCNDDDENKENFWVSNPKNNGKKKFICDLDVYTKDREFRLYGSTKKGNENRFLIPCLKRNDHRYSFFPKSNPRINDDSKSSSNVEKTRFDDRFIDYNFFLDSLICYVRSGIKIRKLLRSRWISGSVPYRILTLMNSYERRNILRLGRTGSNDRDDEKENREWKISSHFYKNTVVEKETTMNLFASIAQDIENMVNADGSVNFMCHYEEVNCLVFGSTGKYCEIKGTLHNNNHPYYICWLRTKIFYQRCFDPECKLKMIVKSGTNPDKIPDEKELEIALNNGYVNKAKGFNKWLSIELWREINEYLGTN